MNKTRWGIISTGGIANFFAEGLTHVEDAELIAVGSRTQASADAFGDKWNVPRRYDSYQALVDDPDVDAVYIGTPHNYHRDNAIMAIEAGKAVLCEKPFAVNYDEALAMVELAREKGVFLMEAMWTRFLPAYVRIRELLAAGAIGEVRMVQADFCFDADYDPQHRLFNPDLAGGALLDVGIYPIAFAYMVLGEPQQVTGTAIKAPTGVDEHSCYMFQYEGGVTALLSSSVATRAPVEAKIIGTKGYIKVPQPFFNARSFVLARHGGESEFIYEGKIFDEELIEVPTVGVGYNYEAAAVGQYLREGKTESDIIPLDETLSMMKTMDSLRAQWGLKYPFE